MTEVIKLVTSLGTYEVEFDITQAQEDGEAKYTITDWADDKNHYSTDVRLGDSIDSKVCSHAINTIEKRGMEKRGLTVHGLIVDEHRLGTFLHKFDELEIFNGGDLGAYSEA